ncbi:ATP-binding cassette domain-containing protein [Fusibacter paucivorans]|uniref:ATP-binding cassette domain-containing protein n=1 Tax=Fusibacter paucivorans TaxID=76009 RepID=A0ABS5PR62_9FIRM|nr:oligopeptide/dipeptide ABC transporter ATP-binding protein [Fusibacter paucivorans]MBS7527655.1 ATP-binding cassette domain-containing protein [Fusibacter paucivorans]
MKPLLEVKNLKKYFSTPAGQLHAVDDVTFNILPGETLGVVGESGCGKSTLGRVILNLLPATDGEIYFEDEPIVGVKRDKLMQLRRNIQIIFQDPFSSLDPRMTVSELISEPLETFKIYKSKSERIKKVESLMDTVGLAARLYNTYPHELDGGRRQRIGIARALALDPKFIVCDEPVSALDVSIQAQILNLMQDIQAEKGLTYIFITHNLSVVKHISNDILVMYLGKMMEKSEAEDLFNNTLHPYSKALLSAIPDPSIDNRRKRILLKGELTSPINPKPGCRFAVRCPYAKQQCFEVEPELEEVLPKHFVACHLTREINQL